MKKNVLILLLTLYSCFTMAQGHLEFKGIPIDGKVNEFVNKLKENGYVQTYQDGYNFILKGEFTGKKASIIVLGTKKTGTVWKVAVNFEKSTSWNSLKSDYEEYKKLFVQKYGAPTNDYHFFSKPYYEGDGYELQALRKEKCYYVSFFKTENGMLSVKLSKTENLSLEYEDSTNAVLQKEENETSIINEI